MKIEHQKRVSYRVETPSKAIIAADQRCVCNKPFTQA